MRCIETPLRFTSTAWTFVVSGFPHSVVRVNWYLPCLQRCLGFPVAAPLLTRSSLWHSDKYTSPYSLLSRYTGPEAGV